MHGAIVVGGYWNMMHQMMLPWGLMTDRVGCRILLGGKVESLIKVSLTCVMWRVWNDTVVNCDKFDAAGQIFDLMLKREPSWLPVFRKSSKLISQRSVWREFSYASWIMKNPGPIITDECRLMESVGVAWASPQIVFFNFFSLDMESLKLTAIHSPVWSRIVSWGMSRFKIGSLIS